MAKRNSGRWPTWVRTTFKLRGARAALWCLGAALFLDVAVHAALAWR